MSIEHSSGEDNPPRSPLSKGGTEEQSAKDVRYLRPTPRQEHVMDERAISLPVKCLSCNEQLTTPIVCDGCHTLYPVPQSADFFDLLSIPRTFALDSASLSRAYRSIARQIHPDTFGGDSIEARNLSTRLSAQINEAFATLRDPVKRAAYILEIAGGPSAIEVREVPGTLLGEVMMLREEIEQAQKSGDEAAMEKHRGTITTRREDTLRLIADRADALWEASDEDKKAFRVLLNSIKYFDNLLAELQADPLAAGKDH